jgi:hypothetical protein
MQCRIECSFDWRLFLDPASAFAPPDLSENESGGDDEPEEQHWRSRISGLYAIQFLNFDTGPIGGDPEIGDPLFVGERVSRDGHCEEHLIQIQLKQINITVPVADDVTSGWTDLQWWYYLLKYSDQFTEHEMRRCQELGMPKEVRSGLTRLNPEFWTDEVDREYRDEIESPPYKPIEEALSQGYQFGKVEALIYFFIKMGSLDLWDDADAQERLPVNYVRTIWEMCPDAKRAPERCGDFIEALRERHWIELY